MSKSSLTKKENAYIEMLIARNMVQKPENPLKPHERPMTALERKWRERIRTKGKQAIKDLVKIIYAGLLPYRQTEKGSAEEQIILTIQVAVLEGMVKLRSNGFEA